MLRNWLFTHHNLNVSNLHDGVEKLGIFGGLLVTQKIDLHNRSVLNDWILGNIKLTPKIGQKNGFRVFQHNLHDTSHSLMLSPLTALADQQSVAAGMRRDFGLTGHGTSAGSAAAEVRVAAIQIQLVEIILT